MATIGTEKAGRPNPARAPGDRRRNVWDWIYSLPFYPWTLRGPTPRAIRLVPPDPWVGNPEIGRQIVDGQFPFAGRHIEVFGFDNLPADLSRPAREFLHGFTWLRDLRACGSDRAAPQARTLVDGWLTRYNRWQIDSWPAHVLADRLMAWLRHFEFLTAGTDDAFTRRLLSSMATQVRHLRRTLSHRVPDARRLHALKALCYGGLCLPGFEGYFDTGLTLLEQEIARQVWPDGGHIERCPETQARVLGDCLDLRATLLAADQDVPDWLQGAIDRMPPLLRALRHGDGGLALFNGGGEGDRTRLDALFAQAKARGRPLSSAPHTGFHRLAAGRSVIIVDAGPPPPPGADRTAHAGTLSFEFSVGRERIIVNCGTHVDADPQWMWALRATAAHSTLVVDDANSADLVAGGGLKRRPVDVNVSRREFDGNLLIEASHDGYSKPFGLVHRRSLFLAAVGDDVRGEDEVAGSGGKAFAIRFHLHPRVQASLLAEGTGVLLKTAAGTGWRFRAEGGTLALEESVYLGTEAPRRTQQIVLSGRLDGQGITVKWRLSRV